MFVWLRNRTRGHGATTPTTKGSACVALSESLGAIVAGYPGFRRPWAHLHRNLSGKYRVSHLSDEKVPFAHLKNEDSHTFANGTYIVFDRPRFCALLITDADLNDFFVPNGQGSAIGFEVLSYLTDDQQTVKTDRYSLPAAARAQSETAARQGLDVVGNLLTNMPGTREHYVARPHLEGELSERLLDDRYPVITLQGRGGIGKTSLALTVLHQLAQLNEVEVIYWASARDIDLLPEGHKAVKAGVLTVQDVAADFQSVLAPDSNPADAEQYLTDVLSGRSSEGPIIFVVDNFETIRGQVELHSWLSNAVRLPNKVLVTTRTRDFKADYPIVVHGMLRPEFDELVNEVATRLQIKVLIDEEYRDRLFEESGGHPYIAKVLLGELARTGQRTHLKKVVATRDGMLDALFERSFENLTSAGQRVFLTLAKWRTLIPRVGLEAVLLRTGNERLDLAAALDELERSSLVELVTADDSANEFVSVPLAASLFGQKKLVTSEYRFAVDADIEVLRDFGVTQHGDAARYGLQPKIEAFARQAARRADSGEAIDQQLESLEFIASSYPPAWRTLADIQAEVLGDSATAIGTLNKYLESYPEDQDAWRRVIYFCKQAGSSMAELNARVQLCDLTGSYEVISATANRLNEMLSNQELDVPHDERRLIIDRVRLLMEAGVDGANGTDLSRLAWLCYSAGDTDSARTWIESGLARDPMNIHLERLSRKL